MKQLVQTMACAASLLMVPLTADAYRTINGQDVNQMKDGVFEVVGGPGAGPREYWCSAGNYARAVLRVQPTQRIYITRGRGPSETSNRRSAVQFSLQEPPGKYVSGYSLSVTDVGENLSASAAQNYCAGSRRRF